MSKSRLIPPFTGIAAVLAMLFVFYATTTGIGVGGDATIYLTTARNFAQGAGLGWIEADGTFRILPYTPPFYPLLLSLLSFLGNLEAAARLLNLVLFASTVALTGFFASRYTEQPLVGVSISALLASSPVLLGVHVWAMTEPLFLFLGFSGLLLLLEYLNTSRRRELLFAALLCGLAFLTRYIGAAFVVTGGLALLLFARGEDRRIRISTGRRELGEALQFGFVSVLPIIIWFIADIAITGTVGSRSGQPAAAYWQRFLEMGPALQKIYLFWLVPDSVSARLPGILQVGAWFIPLVGILILGVFVFHRLHATRSPAPQNAPGATALRLAGMFILFTLVYLAVLAVAQVFTYPPITLASRMLAPVHLAVLVWIPLLLYFAATVLAPRSRLVLPLLIAGLLAFSASYALRSVMVARDYHNSGIGYNAATWRGSATIAALKHLPQDVPLISNETTAIMYLAGRPAYALQEIYQDHPVESFTIYGEGDDPAQRVFREQGGALVLFKVNLEADFAMYGDQVDERLDALTRGLFVYFTGEDGAIYFTRPPEFAPLGQ